MREQQRGSALLLCAALSIGILGSGLARASDGDGPSSVVEQTTNAVLGVLVQKDRSLEDRHREIEKIVYQRFDFDTMSRLVLARNWKKFSGEQRIEFKGEFKCFLSRRYSERIERYDQETLKIIGEQEEPRGDVSIRTRIVGGQFDGIEIKYRMRNADGRWRVIDVVIEGVSLISNYRSQFKEIVGQGGPEKLLKQLREKNSSAIETGSVES